MGIVPAGDRGWSFLRGCFFVLPAYGEEDEEDEGAGAQSGENPAEVGDDAGYGGRAVRQGGEAGQGGVGGADV